MSKYEQLRNAIINSKDLDNEKKVLMLRVLDLYLSFDSEEDAKETEDDIYTINGNILTDVERVKLEMIKLTRNRVPVDPILVKYVQSLNEKNYKYPIDYLYKNKNNGNEFLIEMPDIVKAKQQINEYSLKINDLPGFCTVYDSLLTKYIKNVDIKNLDKAKFNYNYKKR